MKKKVFSFVMAFLMLLNAVIPIFSKNVVHAGENRPEVITDIYLTRENGVDIGDEEIAQWESMKIFVKFKLPDHVVKEGDTTSITIPDGLIFKDSMSFKVKDSSDNLVANGVIDPNTRTVTITYTKYAEEHSGVTGSFFFYAYVDHNKYAKKGEIPLVFKVNEGTTYTKKIKFKGVGQTNKDPLLKSGWKNSEKPNTLEYGLHINRGKKVINNVSISDKLESQGIEYDKDSFEIKKGSWKDVIVEGIATDMKLENEVDITSTYKPKIKFADDNKSFTLELGDLKATDGIAIRYRVKINYDAQDGEFFKNEAILRGNGKIEKQSAVSNRFNIAGGSAEGYVYKIGLTKLIDGTAQPMKDIEFDVIRDRNKAKVGTIKTGQNGYGEITGLLKDDYTLVEVNIPSGYSPVTKEIKVKASDFDSGTKIAKVIAKNRKIQDIKASIEVKKSLTGRVLKNGEFTFELYKLNNQQEVLLKSTTNDGEKVVFDVDINSAMIGQTLKYRIKEKDTGAGGITYDKNHIDVEIKVSAENGQLNTDIKYTPNEKEFKNSYKPSPAFTILKAKKSMDNPAFKLNGGEFTFEVWENGQIIKTTQNKSGGEVVFDKIEYTTTGEHNYVIKEKQENKAGVIYSNKEFKVTVKVTDDGNGRLLVTEKYDDGEARFINNYKAGKTEVKLKAKKLIDGTGFILSAGKFEFEVVKEDTKELVTSKTNEENGEVNFDPIAYDKAGEYKYIIREKKGMLPGVEYSTQEFKVTVTVTDDGKGQLKATVKYEDANVQNEVPEFTNKYKAKGTEIVLEAKKLLEGTGLELKADMFEFTLFDKEQNKVIQTKKNGADGKVVFDKIDYTKAGEHNYIIKETKGNISGVTYDEREVKVKVTITDDGKGQLKAETVYEGGKAEFTNKYKAKPIDVIFEAKKILEGTGLELKADMFGFELFDNEQNKVIQTKKNDADGKVVFDKIDYTEVGEHNYVIKEVKESLAGVTYSDAEYKVKVTVTDDGTGQLKTTVKYEDVNVNNNIPEFTNKYKAKPTDVILEAKKTLEGKKLEENLYEFELESEDGTKQVKKNEADGRVVFDKLTFDKAGEYKYTMKEKVGTLGGITYDETTYEVVVKVLDEGVGQLRAEVKITDNNGAEVQGTAEFKNVYNAKPVSIELMAKKTLEGKKLDAEMFEFELIDKDGKVIQAKKNGADGKVNFEKMTYDSVGEYKYTIREKKGELGGITYDEKSYPLTVIVTDNGEGQLEAEIKIDGAEDIIFVNTYKAKVGKAKIEAKKVLEGKTLKDGQFEFELVDENGKVIQTKKNESDGKIIFDEISYDKEGIYTYTVREVKGNEKGYTYSKDEIKVKVKAVDNGEGQILTEVEYEKEAVFVNKFTPEKKIPKTAIGTEMVGYIAMAVLSAGLLQVSRKRRNK